MYDQLSRQMSIESPYQISANGSRTLWSQLPFPNFVEMMNWPRTVTYGKLTRRRERAGEIGFCRADRIAKLKALREISGNRRRQSAACAMGVRGHDTGGGKQAIGTAAGYKIVARRP